MNKPISNRELGTPFSILTKDTSAVYELQPNSNKTVQPTALLRLSVFTPVAPKERGKRDFQIDASEELGSLEIARQEGYTNIRIQGAKLSMSTDFKTWIGIISAFSLHGFTSEQITLPFTQFARLCGLNPNDMNKRMRVRIAESLFNLASVTLSFRSPNAEKFMTSHLVQHAKFNAEDDVVELIGDKNLWELYRYDSKVLLGLRALGALSRKEAAQSLYVYFESMPPGTLYISMKRLRDRLAMQSAAKSQNSVIRRALEDLKNIGYLNYSETKKGRDIQINIFARNARLRPL